MREVQPELMLWEAVEWGTLEDLSEAIASAKDMDVPGWYRGRHGFTALSKAAYIGKLDFVKELIKAGADPKKGSVNNSLTAAAGGGHLEIVEYLINEVGMDVDTGNEYGHTALSEAAYNNHPKMLRYLLDRGARPNLCASDSSRAIDCAAMSPECFTILYPLTKYKARQRALKRFWSQQRKIALRKGVPMPEFPGIPTLPDQATTD
jgi:hypothetical protein